jgi:hypothetical protein
MLIAPVTLPPESSALRYPPAVGETVVGSPSVVSGGEKTSCSLSDITFGEAGAMGVTGPIGSTGTTGMTGVSEPPKPEKLTAVTGAWREKIGSTGATVPGGAFNETTTGLVLPVTEISISAATPVREDESTIEANPNQRSP